MAWSSRPTLAVLRSRIKADIKSLVEGAAPYLKGTLEFALAEILAYHSSTQHGHIDWAVDQIFPDTQTNTFFWRFCAIWGITRKSATKWAGTYTFSGTGTPTIPAGTVLQDTGSGAEYETQADLTLTAGSGTVAIEARTGFEGAAANLIASAPLSLISPILNVFAEGEVASVTTTATDLETRPEAFLRLLQRIRNSPGAGTEADYVRWALEVAGFTRAWAYGNANGAGTVVVAAVRDNESPVVPDSTERATLLDYLLTKAPVTADVSIRTLTELAVDFTIAVTPDTTAVRDAVEAELTDLFARVGEPAGSIALSTLAEAISSAQGETSHLLTVPASAVTTTATQVPVLGTITWA